jgi:hypothetical protein
MSLLFNSTSRFKNTEPIVVDGKETLGRWVRPDFLKEGALQEQDIVRLNIDQKYAGRPDVIATDLYGTPSLDWVITMYCRPINTLGWPRAGTVIKVPSTAAVQRSL